MMTMDFWYDLATRAPADLNEAAANLLRDAEGLRLPPAEDAEEDDD
jgi:hypothetical protein